MKKAIVFAVLTLLFAACKKDEEKPSTPAAPAYSFKFKINGTEYSGTSVTANQPSGDNSLAIACVFTRNGVTTSMGSFVGSYSGPKTYTGDSCAIIMGAQTGDTYSSLPLTPVTIKITEDNNNEIKGEFSGTLYKDSDTAHNLFITVTDGTFYTKVQR